MMQRKYRIHGRVQGVGFRHFVMTRARSLRLRGFVRNLADGSVECLAAGPAEQLLELERHLRQGPAHSRVAGVDAEDSAWPESQLADPFEVEP